MSKVHQMLDVTAKTADQTSSVVHFQQEYDEAGLYQITVTVGSLTDCTFYGRLSSEHDWTEIATSGAVTAHASIGGAVASLSILPQMYVLADINAEATFKVSIQE